MSVSAIDQLGKAQLLLACMPFLLWLLLLSLLFLLFLFLLLLLL